MVVVVGVLNPHLLQLLVPRREQDEAVMAVRDMALLGRDFMLKFLSVGAV
jgi:hypothetical protein